VPRVKEPRFLQPGRFGQTTVSRYKVNFDGAVARADSVTFDASPIYLRSDVARAWLPKWLPEARLIVLVRNPSQRSYSHWKMGREWMASKCTRRDELERLAPLDEVITFEALMERSLLQMAWTTCVERLKDKPPLGKARVDAVKEVGQAPKSFKWMALPERERRTVRARMLRRRMFSSSSLFGAAEDPDGKKAMGEPAPVYECLRAHDEELTAKFEPELLGDWPYNASHVKQLEKAVGLLGHCSEQMLSPPGALQKGAMYGAELEKWAAVIGSRSQIKVIHTDELSWRPQQLMDETFDFLGLQRIPIGNETRMCVHGKAGVMDVLNAFEGSVRIGANGNDTATIAEQLHVAPCDPGPGRTHSDHDTSALHHDINPWLEQRMRKYYDPHNQVLYRFIGRDLGW